GASGFAPAHTMSHGGVTRGHRLTVDADLLTQPSRDARLRTGKLDSLGANPTCPTNDPPLAIDERHVMRGPGQVVPCPFPRRSHPAGASAAAATSVPTHTTSLNFNHEATALAFVHRHDSKSRQPQDPRTIASRSHPSSLVVSTSRENTIQFRMATWDRVSSQAAEQTAHPNCGPRRRPGISSNRCTQIGEQPYLRESYMCVSNALLNNVLRGAAHRLLTAQRISRSPSLEFFKA